MQAADISLAKSEGDRGGHIIGHTRAGKAIYAPQHGHYENVPGPGEFSRPSKVRQYQAFAGALQSRFKDYRPHDHIDAATAHMGAALSARRKTDDIRAAHAPDKVDWHGVVQAHSQKLGHEHASLAHLAAAGHEDPFAALRVMEEAHTRQAGLHKSAGHGEGSRGGHVIGHTKSGRPVYADQHAGSPHYHAFSAEDHAEAARLHATARGRNVHPSLWDNPTEADLAAPELSRLPEHHQARLASHRRASDYLSGATSKSRLGRTTNFHRIPPARQSEHFSDGRNLDDPSWERLHAGILSRASQVAPHLEGMPSVDHEDMARAYEKEREKKPSSVPAGLIAIHRAAARHMAAREAQQEADNEAGNLLHAAKRAKAVQDIRDHRASTDQMFADTAKLLNIPKELALKQPASDGRTASGKPILSPYHPAFDSKTPIADILPSYTAQDHRDAAKHLDDYAGHMLPDLRPSQGDWAAHHSVRETSLAHKAAAEKLDAMAAAGEPVAKSEGARGGHVIGHTRSGMPIYGRRHAVNQGHKRSDIHANHALLGYTRDDHADAAARHMAAHRRSLAANQPRRARRHLVLSAHHSAIAIAPEGGGKPQLRGLEGSYGNHAGLALFHMREAEAKMKTSPSEALWHYGQVGLHSQAAANARPRNVS